MLNKLLLVGDKDGLKGHERFQLQMRNGIAYATLFVVFCYILLHITQHDDPRIYYSYIIYITTAIGILTFNAYHQYKTVGYIIMTAYPMAFFMSSILIGKLSNIE